MIVVFCRSERITYLGVHTFVKKFSLKLDLIICFKHTLKRIFSRLAGNYTVIFVNTYFNRMRNIYDRIRRLKCLLFCHSVVFQGDAILSLAIYLFTCVVKFLAGVLLFLQLNSFSVIF